MTVDAIATNSTVCRRDTVGITVRFARPLPSTWTDLVLNFDSVEGGQSLTKFVKRKELPTKRAHDAASGPPGQYTFVLQIEGIDPVGTFVLRGGKVALADGFVIAFTADANLASSFTLTVTDTPAQLTVLAARLEDIVPQSVHEDRQPTS
jgi:hypothetical protein